MTHQNEIEFDKGIPDVEQRLARFISELVRQGITFKVCATDGFYVVRTTGGF